MNTKKFFPSLISLAIIKTNFYLKNNAKLKRIITFILLLLISQIAKSQTTDFTIGNCPECTNTNIAVLNEIDNKYLGVKGFNPSRPSTYKLLGANKYTGGGISDWDDFGTALGDVFLDGLNPYSNWFPIRTQKQILCGTVMSFGISNWGGESDWNIHLLPNAGFESLISDALEFRPDRLLSNIPIISHWGVTTDGKFTIEVENTPRRFDFNNRWFNNYDEKTSLKGKMIGVYGPFVGELIHGMRPEIHPGEQLWWKENNNTTMILLVCDASNRFDDNSDYESADAEANWKPWTHDKGQEAELSIPFKINPKKSSLYYSVQAVETPNFYEGANYPDASSGTKHTITFNGTPVLTVEESLNFDKYIGITFKDVCYRNDTLRGLIVLKTAIGNGGGGKEGFAALQIDKQNLGLNPKKGLVIGNITGTNNSWSPHNMNYDDSMVSLFGSTIISSDKEGKGIVDGIIDFNGNGITDLFTSLGGKWLVMYDAKGKWTEINNTSDFKLSELRFGDIDGDKKTDILHVKSNHRLHVSFGGTGRWDDYSDVEGVGYVVNYNGVRVGDFNGDGKTDIIRRVDRMEASMSYAQIDLDIKYSCSGEWKKLQADFHVYDGDLENKMRFGDFNGDGITDIFRYYNGKFMVYWSGRGNMQLLCTPRISDINVANKLLFVKGLSKKGVTDIIYIKESTKAWKIYYEGKTTAPGRVLKYNDIDNILFGVFNPNELCKPITMDFLSVPVLSDQVPMVVAAKIKREPFVIYNYRKGSIKPVLINNKTSLVYDMDAAYYTGNDLASKTKNYFKAVSSVKSKSGLSQPLYKPTEEAIGNNEIIGRIENIPLNGAKEEEIEIKFATEATPYKIKTPGYSIGILKSRVEETINGVGNLENWSLFIKNGTDPNSASILLNSPNKTELIKNITWELIPFYSGIEDNKITLMEMPDAMKELNAIAYGKDTTKIKEIFGDKNVFEISWNFKLTDLTTGQNIFVENPLSSISNGRWANNKMTYSFPVTNNLLELRVTASAKDNLGNKSLNSDVFTFYNQRVKLGGTEIKSWAGIAFSTNKKVVERFKKRVKLNPNDITISPLELKQLLK